MDLSQMRTRVRQDLHDQDATNYRWTDAELDRHIEHGVDATRTRVKWYVSVAVFNSLKLAKLAGVRD